MGARRVAARAHGRARPRRPGHATTLPDGRLVLLGGEVVSHLTRVLVEQAGAIGAPWLGDHLGHLSIEEQWGVDLSPATVLGRQ